MNISSKALYFAKAISLSTDLNRKSCPCCGKREATLVSRKWLVTALRRCQNCSMLYRTPITTSAENHQFYQFEYRQGSTTDFPSQPELRRQMAVRFKGTERDYTKYIDVLAAMGVKKGARILDFGCSWGYGSWQLATAGYDVVSYEISQPRAEYAKTNLGVKVYTDIARLNESEFDVFFSAHVLEHVPSPVATIAFAKRKLRSGGSFLAFTPNGSDAFLRADRRAWQKLWGLVHPNFLDDQFYRRQLPGVALFSSPYDLIQIENLARGDKTNIEEPRCLDGYELMALYKKNEIVG